MGIVGLIYLSFKKIREFFPPSEIGSQKIIGYAQYSGYPFNFDTIYFGILIFAPLIAFGMVIIRKKWINRK